MHPPLRRARGVWALSRLIPHRSVSVPHRFAESEIEAPRRKDKRASLRRRRRVVAGASNRLRADRGRVQRRRARRVRGDRGHGHGHGGGRRRRRRRGVLFRVVARRAVMARVWRVRVSSDSTRGERVRVRADRGAQAPEKLADRDAEVVAADAREVGGGEERVVADGERRPREDGVTRAVDDDDGVRCRR